MDQRQFHQQLYDAARRLIPTHSTVVCAVSGGADSVALVCGLTRVNELHDCRWKLQVGHLDHQLRPESTEDARFVSTICEGLGISCTVETVDVRGLALELRVSIESAARSCRHAFLAKLAERQPDSVVAMAHHADDQAETILHRILRGTGLRGLAGMRHDRPMGAAREVRLVRPLLGFSRETLRSYLSCRSIEWREDASNSDPHIATRNRIRQTVLPFVRQEINPRAAEALVQLGEHARRAATVIRDLAEESLSKIIEHDREGVPSLRARAFSMLPRAIQTECIVVLLERLGVGLQEIGFERLEAVADLAECDGKSRRIELTGGVIATRSGGLLKIGFGQEHETPTAAEVAGAEVTNS